MSSTLRFDTWKSQDGTREFFKCRAWINYSGVSNVIRASGNVSSITDNGNGQHTVNFSVAMPDANYAVACSNYGVVRGVMQATNHATSSVSIGTFTADTAQFTDSTYVDVAIFR